MSIVSIRVVDTVGINVPITSGKERHIKIELKILP